MRSRFGKPILAVVFVALLATPALIRHFNSRATPPRASSDVDSRA
jgi:hypothetical protein